MVRVAFLWVLGVYRKNTFYMSEISRFLFVGEIRLLMSGTFVGDMTVVTVK